MNYSITISGQPYTLSTSDDAQIAAIAACRAAYNASLPQTISGTPVDNEDGTQTVPQVANPALIDTDAKYLEFVFTAWAAANPGFTDADLQAAAASAFASYAGQNPPKQIIEDVPLTGDALKSALKAYAASKRYQVETGGMTAMGTPVPTDRETQSKLTGAVLGFQSGALVGAIDWKASSGWLTLDQATVTALASAVAAHVQAAFSKEKLISVDIDGGVITTVAQIDAYNWS